MRIDITKSDSNRLAGVPARFRLHIGRLLFQHRIIRVVYIESWIFHDGQMIIVGERLEGCESIEK